MELKLLPNDLMTQRECSEILSDYISSFKYLHCKVFSTIRYSICILIREMVKYEGTQGKEKDLEQFSEAINIIRLYTRRRIIRPSYIFLFQSDDVIWTQCPKWRWQW